MSLIERMLRQKAVYWPPAGTSDDAGRPINANPIELKVRWEDCTEEIINKEGRKIMTKAKIFVNQDVVEGGILWQGPITAIDPAADPYTNDGAWEIVKFDKIPNIKCTKFVRIAYL